MALPRVVLRPTDKFFLTVFRRVNSQSPRRGVAGGGHGIELPAARAVSHYIVNLIGAVRSPPCEAAARLALLSLDDQDAVRAAAKSAIESFPAAVEDYRRGKTAAIGRLIGETIKNTGGRAKPDEVRAILIEELSR